MRTALVVSLAILAGGCVAEDGSPSAPTGVLVITEVAAQGTPEDWFELYNASDEPVTLSDYVFVDAAGDLERAERFPVGVVLAPGAHFVQEVRRRVHRFRLGSDEELWIYHREDGTLSDGVDWHEGAAPRGGSYARTEGGFVTVRAPSRGVPSS